MNDHKKEKSRDNKRRGKWVSCPVEEDYFKDSLKLSRQERKRLSFKDRSKFKKTDYQKFEQEVEREIQERREGSCLLRGRVLSIASQGVIVEHEGHTYTCFLRGLLKKEKRQKKNLVTVGDFVSFETLPDNEGIIAAIEPRKSVLSRADNLSRNKEQLIAANIDQVLITVSVVAPLLKPHLIDRYIIAAKKGNMAPVIVVNKLDLLDHASEDEAIRREQAQLLEATARGYQREGIPFLMVSVKEERGMEALREIMKDKASVFSGQSGTGKSSLINAVAALDLPVGQTVQKTRKGAHTTTSAQLILLPFGGFCIDTPGIKSFGIWDITKEELQAYFLEIHELSSSCKYPDCTHTHEKDCAVLHAYHEEIISSVRYQSYLALLQTLQEEHKRR